MSTEALKTYLENTLLYLEKDWEWSPIILSALRKGELDDRMIHTITDILSEAIESCRDDEKRENLTHARDTVRDYIRHEQESQKIEQSEANTLISSFI
jgi:hypothetical protein